MATAATHPKDVGTTDFDIPFVDFDPVVDPTKELSAETYNTMVSNVVAATQVAPRAWCSVDSAGDLSAAGWAGELDGSVQITSVATGTGVYRVTIVDPSGSNDRHPSSPSAIDMTGRDRYFLALPYDTFGAPAADFATVRENNYYEYDVYLYTHAGVAADCGFTLWIW